MGESPKISDAVALEAKRFIEGVADGSIVISGKEGWHRVSAAKDLYRFYQAQEKYPSAEKRAHLASTTNAPADVRDLEHLTDEDLNAKVVSIRGRQAG